MQWVMTYYMYMYLALMDSGPERHGGSDVREPRLLLNNIEHLNGACLIDKLHKWFKNFKGIDNSYSFRDIQ